MSMRKERTNVESAVALYSLDVECLKTRRLSCDKFRKQFTEKAFKKELCCSKNGKACRLADRCVHNLHVIRLHLSLHCIIIVTQVA